MPEPQIVIVVNSLTEAHKLERELVRDRQNACGYRPRQKDECRFCKHAGYATTLKQIYRGGNQ
jgi:hypothetical protein